MHRTSSSNCETLAITWRRAGGWEIPRIWGSRDTGGGRGKVGVGSYKMLGSGRKEGNYETMLNILQYKEKRLKVGVQAKRGGSRECKALEAGDLDSLSPLPLSHLLRTIIYHRPNFLICDTRTVLVNLLHNMILSCWDKRLTKFIT